MAVGLRLFHNGNENTSMVHVRPVPAGFESVQALQELNSRMEDLCGRIEHHLADQSPPIRANRIVSLRCPQCNKRAFRKSRRATIGEHLSAFLLMAPFRCRYCNYFEFRSLFTGSGLRKV